MVEVRIAPGKGRGVFARETIPANRLVVVNVVGLIEVKALCPESVFNDYPMEWTRVHDAIAFGVINLLNHAETPNCKIIRYKRKRIMECWTRRRIQQGEELTIDYGHPLWFTPKEE